MRALPLLLATVLTIASGISFAAGSEETFIGGNVASLLDFARTHHPEFAALRLEAEAAATRVVAASTLPDPLFRMELRDVTNEVSGGGINLLPGRVGSTRYMLTQTLPWFGKRELRREVAAAEADEANARTRAGWLELATRIKQTYAQHYVHLHTKRLLDESLDLLQRLGEVALTRYANGLAPQQDAIRAQVEYTMLKSDLAMLEGESAQSIARMRSLLGHPPAHIKLRSPDELQPLPPAAKLEFAALEARLRANNPQLAQDVARIRAADKSRALTYRNRYPDVMLGIAPTQMRTRISEWELMFEVNIPLRRESRRAQEREAERLFEAAALRHDATFNQALADLAEAIAGFEAARRVETLIATSLLPQAELTLQSALAGYENGRVDFAAVLDAQREIRRAQQELIKVQGEQRLRLADIERLIGEEL